MEALLVRQAEILDTIKTIQSNFKKDSASRKTPEYLEKRLTTLDNLWEEFEQNNRRLVGVKDESQEYFKENIFDRTRDLYQDIRKSISSFNKQEKATQPCGEVDKLLLKQRTNFRAFARLVHSLSIDNIIEKWELEDELRNIQSLWNTIASLHLEIDHFLRGSDIMYEEEFSKYEIQYKNIKRTLHQKLSSTIHTQLSTPQLEIPSFSGNYLQWPTFYSLFQEAICNNNMLTKTQKMQHLKGKLRGEAERLIQHLNITANNFDIAWDILVHRYNNPLLLFTHQIETFLNQPNVHRQTAYELKKLHDTSLECIHAIDNLGIDTTTWDPLLVHLLSKKLDAETYRDYKESRQAPRELPTLSEFISFLEGKFTALEPIFRKERDSNTPSSSIQTNQNKLSLYKRPTNWRSDNEKYHNKSFYAQKSKCPLCKLNHDFYKCGKFAGMSDHMKLKTIEQLDICKNCLYKHYKGICNSTKRCKLCNESHNTLLHASYVKAAALPFPTSVSTSNNQPNSKQHNVNHIAADDEEILLTTLLLKVLATDGTYHTLRALLDQGSQITLISENAVQRLGLQRQKCHASVAGVGLGAKQGRGTVLLNCKSIYDNYEFYTQALVISKVINNLPNSSFSKQSWPHLQNVNLADPEYNLSRPIDILLDASVYSEIIMTGLIKGPSLAPIAQQTKLGWILSGNVKTFNCHVVLNNLSNISKYWEIEDIIFPSALTSGEQYCEDLYKTTTVRRQNGTYQVCLPMKPGYEQQLGSSKSRAIIRLNQLEQKMAKNNDFADRYKQFMTEYKELGDMCLVNLIREPTCYLPHFGIVRPESSTTQLRVVFNASSKTSTGHSLNDLMHRGPNLQADLQALIITWRQYQYVMTADIEKMFRRIYVAESQQPLQSIVWRNSPKEPIQNYQLTTVTYGTKAAPFLAMRTLKQIAKDGASRYPLGSEALNNCFYMDDYLGGNNSFDNAKETIQQLICLLQEAGMNLRKWLSNNANLIENLECKEHNIPLQFKCTESRKTLGLKWNPTSDMFTFDSKIFDYSCKKYTKRQLLSNISKIFDPMGWLSPFTIKAKLLFQSVWVSGISWDEELPPKIRKEWLEQDFRNINQIKIARHLGNTQNKYTLHGFCDSSQKAFACCIYMVTTNCKGENTSTLITAKTRLAPLNKKISLPRLELCAALLLSQLMQKVKDSLSDKMVTTYGWTDSMVVLGWLQGDTSRWKQFVAVRVEKIIKIIPTDFWRYVGTADNPADCATRGITAKQLSEHSLWWQGPKWLPTMRLSKSCIIYPTPDIEMKKCSVNATLHKNQITIITELLNKYSSITMLVRVLARVLRFISRLRNQQNTIKGNTISCTEISNAYTLIIKSIQELDFADDLDYIRRRGFVSKNSKIASLSPFLDDDGLLRVGGRLRNSNIVLSAKHPIILASHSRFTQLIVNQAHLTTLHGGPKLTLAFIRDKYWIVSGNRTVKRLLRLCVRCRRFSGDKCQQIMADLPSPRVTPPSRPYSHCGVDFTGHVELKVNKGRGVKTTKGYIAVFVCLSTKAVHLELVSDLSTPAFLAAFRRFCGRRGTPRHMYSDRGSNFYGANRVLKQEYKEIIASINQEFFNDIASMDIDWHFNAPAWPNAGGLWEAAVKSLKHHIKRVIGEQKLTYEEFTTLLHQIEACLNSRPLCALSENPEEAYLTPGHFLVGGPLLSRPQTDPDSYNLTKRWQLVQSMNKQFWKKWSTEYLQQLQSRSKWRSPQKNLQVGEIVLIKEENLPPGKWALARVHELHPGNDGYVRVVSLKTKNNTIKRPVNKLVLLPVIEKCDFPDESSSQAADSDKNTKRHQRKRNVFTTFIINIFMILSFLISPTLQQNINYNITLLNNNNSLFFDKISNMHLIRDEWKLIVYYNMDPYWQGMELFNKYIKHLDQMCTNANMTSHCDVVLHQLYHGYAELEYYNQMLLHQQLSPRARAKRGLINGVGYIAHELFGVLDERFAEQYRKDIELVQANENNLALLWKNQTAVVEAEYNLLTRMKESMDKQHKMFHHYLNNLEQENNKIKTQIQSAYNQNEFSLGSIIANRILSDLKNVLDTLLGSITNTYNGQSNIHLLKPEQLRNELNIISNQISRDLSLPIYNIHTELAKIYKLFKVKVRITRQYFIFEIKIPLISRERYEICKILPVPQQVKSHMVTIIPAANYIAINLHKDSFISMTEDEIQKCIQFDTDIQLCPLAGPIYNLKSDAALCLKSVDKTCQNKVKPCTPTFYKLKQINTFLYFCCDYCHVTLICNDLVTAERLTKVGIISLKNNCIIKGEHFTIYAHYSLSNELSVQPEFPRIDIFPINNIFNISLPANHTSINDNLSQEFIGLQKQIKSLKDMEIQGVISKQVSNHDIHHYAVIYLMVTCTVVAAGVLVWRRVRTRLAWRPRAAPRLGNVVFSVSGGQSECAVQTSDDLTEQCANKAPAFNIKCNPEPY